MSNRRPDDVRVLYVDGDAATRETVRECLAEADAGLDVRAVDSQAAALATVESEPIDCVVTEHQLPDGTGLDLVDAVRDRALAVPLILYPSDGSEQLAAEATTVGATAYQVRDGVAETCSALAQTVRRAVDQDAERRAALDRMTDGFQVLDEDWRVVYSNDRANQVVREAMPPERREAIDDLTGEVLWEVVPDARDTVFHERYREAMDTQEQVTFESYYEPLSAWFEVRAYPSQSGLSVYFTDVTERKQYEETVAHREGVLTEMHRTIADADHTFEEKVQALFSIGRQELDTEYATLSTVDGDEYTFEHVQAPEGDDAIAAGDVIPMSATSCERAIVAEETLVIEDMADAPPEISDRAGNQQLGLSCYLGTPVIVDGEVTGTFCFYGTEPRPDSFSQWQVTLVELMGNWASYERQRQRREAALTRERNRMEEFASVVSHDLRNPLNVATTRLELAAEDCDSEHLGTVDDALGRMDELIDDVLALARLGQQVVDAERVQLDVLVQMAWGGVETRDASLVANVDEATLVGDRTRLQRLFENLFRNAVEHGSTDPDSQARQDAVEHGSTGSRPEADDAVEHGGADTVTVTVDVLEDGFYVADDGTGIPAEERDEIFDHGYTTDHEGTGFGLSIVEQVVDAHDGTVTVTESDDGGARFEIRGIDVR